MDERILQFRIGAMVLAVLLIAVILMVMFGEGPQLLKPTYTLTIDFPEAPGVTEKTPIRKSGILIGRVTGVELLDDGRVRVTAKIDASYKIFPDETCEITRSLLNDSELEIVKRNPSAGPKDGPTSGPFSPKGAEATVRQASFEAPAAEPNRLVPRESPPAPERAPLGPGARIEGRVRPDPMNAVQSFEDLRNDLKQTAQSVQETSETINQFFARLNGILGPEVDPATQRARLTDTVDQANETMKKIGQLADRMNATFDDPATREALAELPKLIPQIRNSLGQMNATFKLADENLNNMRGFTEALGENGPSIVKQFDRSAEKLDQLMAQLLVVGDSLKESKGTLGKLINDPTLYNNVNQIAGNILSLSLLLEPILRDARVFTDRIARHPETLGVRGALQPSQGTKGVPLLER